MAVSFLNNREVSDLCLGKPALRWVPATVTVAVALSALKRSGESHLSVWNCSASDHKITDEHLDGTSSCNCVGKICMVDVICFLCREDHLADPSKAFEAQVSELLPKEGSSVVKHLEPNASLLEAIDCILEGTQNLVIPMPNNSKSNSRKMLLGKPLTSGSTYHNGRQYCWLTQEDVLRFLLNSIGVFSPIPTFTIEALNIMDRNPMTVHFHEPASSALSLILRALAEQTSVAVIDDNNRLIGEISPFTIACCDETAAAAIATLSAGDLMAYIDCGGPPEDLVQLVKLRLEEKKLGAMLELMEEFCTSSLSSSSSSCSSDDEFGSSRQSVSGRYSPARRTEAIICYPWSSLVAVMIQALAHRAICVWVVDEDHTLIGTVSFEGMLKVFRSVAGRSHKEESVNPL